MAKTLNDEPSAAARAAHFSPLWLILGAAVLWSTGGVFIKLGEGGGLSDAQLSGGRALFAAAAVMWLTRREGFGANVVTGVAAVLYALLLFLFVRATMLTTAANAIFLQYTAPVYILVFEPLFYKEKYRWQDFAVILVCLMGMSLFFVGQLRPEDVRGNLAALGSGLCFAGFFLLLRHPRAREVNRASSVIYGNLLLALVTAPYLLDNFAAYTPRNFLLVAYLGVVQIGIAYALLTLGVARGVKSIDAGIVGYIEPVLNPIWVFLALGERPSRYALAGGAIIIAAVAAHSIYKAQVRRLASD
ncbi:MAG: DMT family transporter [Pyrinomonadaceae bacterium]